MLTKSRFKTSNNSTKVASAISAVTFVFMILFREQSFVAIRQIIDFFHFNLRLEIYFLKSIVSLLVTIDITSLLGIFFLVKSCLTIILILPAIFSLYKQSTIIIKTEKKHSLPVSNSKFAKNNIYITHQKFLC